LRTGPGCVPRDASGLGVGITDGRGPAVPQGQAPGEPGTLGSKSSGAAGPGSVPPDVPACGTSGGGAEAARASDGCRDTCGIRGCLASSAADGCRIPYSHPGGPPVVLTGRPFPELTGGRGIGGSRRKWGTVMAGGRASRASRTPGGCRVPQAPRRMTESLTASGVPVPPAPGGQSHGGFLAERGPVKAGGRASRASRLPGGCGVPQGPRPDDGSPDHVRGARAPAPGGHGHWGGGMAERGPVKAGGRASSASRLTGGCGVPQGRLPDDGALNHVRGARAPASGRQSHEGSWRKMAYRVRPASLDSGPQDGCGPSQCRGRMP
jgi:hypothetical protein